MTKIHLRNMLLMALSVALLLPVAACGGAPVDTQTPDDAEAPAVESTAEAEETDALDTESTQADETDAPTENTTAGDTEETTMGVEETTTAEAESERDLGVNILRDATFQNGFYLKNTAENGGGYCKTMPGREEGATPVWEVAQWWCNHLLQDGTETVTDTTYSLVDASKTVAVDWGRGMITLGLDGSQEMETGSTTQWPHLLIEQAIPATPIKDAESVTATITFNVLENEDHRNGSPLHAQFSWFIYLQDRNPDSEGYGNFLWFGLNLFNSVSIGTSPYAAQDTAGGPGNFIYSLGSASFMDKRIWIGRPIEVECDILPHIEAALETAHAAGFMLGTEVEDISITGTNIGWETFDRWENTVTMENMGIYIK